MSMLVLHKTRIDRKYRPARLVFPFWRLDARRKLSWVAPWLKPFARILEVGSGLGSVCVELEELGFDDITPLDVADNSVVNGVDPVIYDGENMPFSNQSYDSALILTVLHHAQSPDQVLREAARVAKRVIVIEDVYTNRPQRWLTKAADSLFNLEFFGHPHNNRSDQQWKQTFQRLGLKLRHSETHRIGVFFQQAVYVLDTQ